MKYILVIMMAALAACSGGRQERMKALMADSVNGLFQVREINGHRFRLTYLPEEKQQGEWCFKLNVELSPEMKASKGESRQGSYGVDTLFSLVSGRDTILPVHAMRVANGNMNGVEYMIIFEKKPWQVENAKFCFSDWLFTHRFLEFPIQLPAINKIDSISSRI
ncbi:hypothetical protein GFS24_06475 [Chitinophaga sp. SYP-B3965]|uniref:hypothetical protein n=1 Tax=Chitinophaga sp. SYP-B3965 TaxID=2663120 RepID=UPI001299AA42|nr:hypothetical protein [Chitinophaga sp. SYP-B3965]MRG44750.1 hypothetical protein [Chitinophaga sp. SYP-B3965]